MSAIGSLTSGDEERRPDDWTCDLLIGAAAKLLIARDARLKDFGPLLASARQDLARVADRHARLFDAAGPEPV